ncbi:MAG: carnitine 3-dehydrogenase [Paracoccaceae bacterium]
MKAAIVGGGVIGGGWAARFVLNGWDVAVFDPDPDVERKLSGVLSNARRSLPALSDFELPPEGGITFAGSLGEAVADAAWVQECVPERLDIKHAVLSGIIENAGETAIIASSTSGFKPSDLQSGLAKPGQVIVAHPFHPVYLLPLVEIVPGPETGPSVADNASELLAALGMKPLTVRREIDAHIADRFLEAVWREALWLIRDDIATTEEIDDAIRFGFGLRWAQMGLFETYRAAGGEAGMKHFIAQFGPCLKSPWTKLMDVPELTDNLVEKIASQSDAQSGRYSNRELERLRDDNLVAILRALKRNNAAAGAVLNAYDAHRRREPERINQAVETLARQVPQSWTDYNGHMNELHYLEAFSTATDRFMELIGADADYIASGLSYFTAETHIRHIGEIIAGEKIRATTQVIHGAGKKLHIFHRLFNAKGELSATGEHLLIHVDLTTRSACDPSAEVSAKTERYAAAHARLSSPEGAGRAVGQRK